MRRLGGPGARRFATLLVALAAIAIAACGDTSTEDDRVVDEVLAEAEREEAKIDNYVTSFASTADDFPWPYLLQPLSEDGYFPTSAGRRLARGALSWARGFDRAADALEKLEPPNHVAARHADLIEELRALAAVYREFRLVARHSHARGYPMDYRSYATTIDSSAATARATLNAISDHISDLGYDFGFAP